MHMTFEPFDKTRFGRSGDPRASMQVDAVVIGACSPALLYGLEAMVAATPGLRFAASAGTLNDFVNACARAGSCVALADSLLASGGVVDLLDTLAGNADQARPVLMTQGIQPLWVREALKRGAFGFVRQSDGIEQIRSALLSAAEGKRYIPGDIATQLADSFMLEDLTNREMQVLGLLSQGRCNKAIARDLEVALGTVKTHVSAIMCKLDVPSRMAAILEANRRGLISIA
jgi:DNA-binding NarL/FixJ family response regulator